MPDNFFDGVIDVYCCKVNSNKIGYIFTAEPTVYISYEKNGHITFEKPFWFRSWITASGDHSKELSLKSEADRPAVENTG